MSRRRVSASPELSWRQDQALGTTMRIVRELGPTAFVLQEEDRRAAELRVSLGNPHSCSCSVFLKEKDLCKHICWLLLKKFKLPRDHEYALQIGLLEREINHLLQIPQLASQVKVIAHSLNELKTVDDGYVKQKSIDNDDICPVCQDTLLKKMLPVTYCRFGCGNNIHIVCMKIWIDHQRDLEKNSLVKCPLCRENFAPLKLILEEFRNCKKLVTSAEKQSLNKHLGIPCNNCRVLPIEGNCYKCTECSDYHLCHGCFQSFCHPSHTFAFREKRNQRWKSFEPKVHLSTTEENLKINPDGKFIEEKNKEQFSCIPQQVLNSIPNMVIRKGNPLLDPGLQCRFCLKIFCLGQVTRTLPCNHKFHRKCIDRWLQKENACPIDDHVVYNPLTWETATSKDKVNQLGCQPKHLLAKQPGLDLFMPGTGLSIKQIKPHHATEVPQSSFQGKCNKKKNSAETEQNLTLNGFSYPCTRDAGSSLLNTQKPKHLKFSRHVKGLVLIPKAHADKFTDKIVGTDFRVSPN
ncbi:E3 ubiquitin-protein ligase ZSWIM2 [Notechis scutatus]|uniref:E3 ubiquitin-protein ligase ZSWIM2 n=1 Tax=Notechis scutatus TaxID=8663 RepID=A0A6J1U5D2_9SAUR|nr:E3 ubiquitin-protein ligase ZSWIM2 [Notechis scutatus]